MITNVVNAYLLLGQKYFTEKDYVKAPDKFYLAHIFDPDNQAARDQLATIYTVRANAKLAEREYYEAVTFSSKALNLKPQLKRLQENLGLALSKIGEKLFLENNFIESVDYFSRAKDNYHLNRKINAKFATALEKKSEIQRDNGDHIGAMSSLLKTLHISPNYSVAELCLHSSILWLMQKGAKCLELGRKTMLELTTHVIFIGFEQHKSRELEALKMLDNVLMGTDMVSTLTFKKIQNEASIQFIEGNLHKWTGVISLIWEPCCSRELFLRPDLYCSRIIIHQSNFKYTEYISFGNVSFSDIPRILEKHTFDQIFLFCSYNSPYPNSSANMRDALVYRYKLLLNCCAVYNTLGGKGIFLPQEIIDIMMTKILLINHVQLAKERSSSTCSVM